MRNKAEKRQEVIQQILRGYGSVDRVDTLCLGVRFKLAPKVINQDVQSVQDALKRQAVAQEREAREVRERKAELELAGQILRGGERDLVKNAVRRLRPATALFSL